VRQTLAEAMVLVGAASVLGVALALQGQRALAALFTTASRQVVLDLSLNARVLLYTLAVSIATGCAFALLPALRAAGADPAAGLQGASRSVAGSRRALRVGRTLMVLQVSLSAVLLAGAGLFLRTLDRLQTLDPGFTAAGVLTMEVAPERSQFGTPAWLALQQHVLDQVQALPGVRAASWSTMSPFSGRDRGTGFHVPGFQSQAPRATEVHLVSVSPDYFETFDVRLASGRGFTAGDIAGGPKVAIVNETTARFYFGNRSPIGQMFAFTRQHAPDYRIVGVVKDARHDSLRRPAGRFVYLPIRQSIDRINRLALTVRGTDDAASLIGPVQRVVRRADATLLITNVATLQQQVDRSLLTERLVSTLAGAFATVALALACIGLYGVLAYAVARRTRELGVRLALGATRGSVVWLLLREALLLAGAGSLLGVPVAVALGHLTQSLLFGVGPVDLASFAAAVLLLLLVAVLAAAVPARRASRLDPLITLRSD
jgi:predicted permease